MYCIRTMLRAVCTLVAGSLLALGVGCIPIEALEAPQTGAADLNTGDGARAIPQPAPVPGAAGPAGSAGLAAPSGGEFGATQGGVQDMGLARELVQNGRVPPPEAFVVEGMFSEHDLGLSGDACERQLCLRGALGVAPAVDGVPSGWMQIGMSSNIDPESFERPSLTLIATVDVSGSMGSNYSGSQVEYATPSQITGALLRAIVQKLGPQDRIAIVTFGSDVSTVLPLTNGASHELILGAIDGLTAEGSTYMEAGVRRAYEIAGQADRETAQTRVMLFTDMQPNVGATSGSELAEMVQAGAADDVGLTIMGVGVGLGQEVLNAMAYIRGGNAFSLFDYDDVADLMEGDWPWLVSPIAYDLRVDVTPGEGYSVADSYGFPAAEPGGDPGFDVSTVFLSRRKGALLVRLLPMAEAALNGLNVTAQLSYQTVAGESIEERIEASYNGQPLDEREQYFEQPGVHKTVALALLTTGMRTAAEQYEDDAAAAIATLQAAIERFAADAAALADQALDAELEFARQLLQLMEQGAEQGDLYGQP